MLIADLVAPDSVIEKIARRGIQPDELQQARRNGAVFTRNPRPRAAGSRFMIGPTDGGRLLTIVIVPDDCDRGIWFVKTAWQSSRGEHAIYLQRR